MKLCKLFQTATFLLAAVSVRAGPKQECSAYGVNAHVPDAQTLSLIAEAGFGWVRLDFNWFEIEPSKGVFVFEPLDQAVDEAVSRGLSVFATLAYSPKWAVADQTCDNASSNPCMTKPPANSADWMDFVLATVKHFKGRVKYWGMWNEPNLKAFFEGSLDDYVQKILVPGAQAVKWEDPAAFVLGPELAGVTSSSQWNGDKGSCVLGVCTFNGWEIDLAQILDKAGSSIDIITHHFYKNSPDELMAAIIDGEFDPLLGLVKTHSSLKEIVAKYAASKEVWLTEYGWETQGYGGYSGGGSLSESVQAQYHVQFLESHLEVVNGTWPQSENDPWPNLTKVFIYDARDSVAGGRLWAFGLLRVDGTPKPAFDAVKSFIADHPTKCPPGPPVLANLPLITLEQGSKVEKAIDLWQYTDDPDTPVEDLVFSLVDPGNEAAGIVLEEGRFISVYPDKSFFGFTKAKIRVEDGLFSVEGECGVSVKPVLKKTYEAVWLKPNIDGDLTEWSGVAQMQLVLEKDWVALDSSVPAGPTDLGANGRVAWDETALYFAFEVVDNVHVANEPAETLWKADSVQIAIDLGNDKTEGEYDDNDWEIGAALAGDEVQVFCFWMPAGAAECPAQAAAKRKGNKTSYEIAFPTYGMPPEIFGFSFLVNENDGYGREGFLQWTPGIGISKDPSKFGTVYRVGSPVPDVAVAEDRISVADEAMELAMEEWVSEETAVASDLGFVDADEVSIEPQELSVGEDAAAVAEPAKGKGGCGCRASAGPPLGETLLFVFAVGALLSRRKPF